MSNVRTEPVEHGGGGGPLVRIGELARRAGIPPATLRAWERRYAIVSPRRGESGYRLYSESDERLVRRMTELVASGLAPAEAARRAIEAPDASRAGTEMDGGDGDGLVADYRDSLASAFSRFDDRAADRALDRAVAVLTIDALLDDVLLPVLRGLEGDSIGQEHFASNLVRGRMLALARGWGGGEGRLALLACPEGELHDLGLIAFGLVLRTRGWRIAFLGANTPIVAVLAAADEMKPGVVVLTAMTTGAFDGSEPDLVSLGGHTRLHLGGPGVTDGLAEAIGATRLDAGPVGSATALAA